ncbi:MAG TPA: hypothetical protein VFS93_07975, partial [Terrimesophilobacter sp.]|nr:hypothetical protein [Terrimesophilobacter sp.]
MGRLTRSTTATITLVGALALALTGCTSGTDTGGTDTGGTTPSVAVGGDTGASPTTPPLGIYGLESAVVT